MTQRTVSLAQDHNKLKKKAREGFLKSLKEELKKVTWTTKHELILCTKIVVGATFSFSLGIYIVDILVRGTVNGLHQLVKLLGF